MKRDDYSKISIEHFAKQLHVDVLTETDGFIVSKKPTKLEEHSIDFNYPHIVEGIALVFGTSGSGKIRINLTEHEVYKGTLLIIAPNSIVQINQQSEDLRIEFLFFTFDFISNIKLTTEVGHIVKLVQEKSCWYLDDKEYGELLAVQELIVKQYQKHKSYREQIIKSFLSALLYQVLQLYSVERNGPGVKTQSRKEEVHMKFTALLFEHYKAHRSVQFYAEKLNLTPKYFSRIIKEVNGKSVMEWIDEMVIMAAKALLKSSNLSVAQISDVLNFANPSFFGSYFKRRVGVTPVKYREQ